MSKTLGKYKIFVFNNIYRFDNMAFILIVVNRF